MNPISTWRALFLLAGSAILTGTIASGNDSSYYTSGDQLTPLQETDISVSKEVLTMRREDGNCLAVTVDYVFRNPGGESKTILMGFEAAPPHGEVEAKPLPTGHPHIENFAVTMNGKPLPHKVAMFKRSEHQLDPPLTEEQLNKHGEIPKSDNYYGESIRYIYHFPATFAPGENSVRHTYKFKISTAVYMSAEIDYLLTPALRWANKQIDDFTLVIDLGPMQEYHIRPYFFSTAAEWKCEGKTKVKMENVTHSLANKQMSVLTVWQKDGPISFHAKNFRPTGEFSLFANGLCFPPDEIDVARTRLPFQSRLHISEDITLRNEFSRKVLLNLPYAQRGHVFQDKQLAAFFATQPWYAPDQNAGEIQLSPREIEWRKEVTALQLTKHEKRPTSAR